MTELANLSPAVLEAAAEYLDRQARRSHPDGRFDRAGRWYPSEQERQSCCDGIRVPSRRFPYSLMSHCRSVGHVARLFGADPKEVRRALRTPGVKELILAMREVG